MIHRFQNILIFLIFIPTLTLFAQTPKTPRRPQGRVPPNYGDLYQQTVSEDADCPKGVRYNSPGEREAVENRLTGEGEGDAIYAECMKVRGRRYGQCLCWRDTRDPKCLQDE